MRLSMAASSVISGSRAAFSMTVCPLASTAAVSRFSVAPTLGNSSTTRAPDSRFARASMKPCTTCELDAHRFEPAEVHVERAAADVVATGHRDARLTAARQQRTEHVDRRAQPRDELVGRLRPAAAPTRRSAARGRRSTRRRRRSRAARRSSRRGRRRRSTLRNVVTPGASNARGHLLEPAFLVAPETRTVPGERARRRARRTSRSSQPVTPTKLSGRSSSSRSGDRDAPDLDRRHDPRDRPLAERAPRGTRRRALGHHLVVGEDLAGPGGVAQARREVDRHADEVVALEHDHLDRRRCRCAAAARCRRSPCAR